ncbi:helix-turn-helix domain-containing protein [Ilyobacter polytropus]|uniref:Transcriptional regulator, XRE family n=1 Tax=Ilyobacter polytropus (strain ATCC 51220 / DSM 2926 / LMG 16218 / CuHBu1) TaxID=572544 RepID=E3HA70_ILYPC|nr:LexA family transcriptional regulator [Ilyobacter polytropus]ADO83475.1 transcriptional regulator, XRE family [Ilyobacter polytropus DSM 2926]
MDFKKFLKDRRKNLGYSQNKFAKSIGITQSYFNTIERGEVKNPPSEEVLDKISQGLQLNEKETETLKYLAALERTPDIIMKELSKLKKELTSAESLKANINLKESLPLIKGIPVYERISAGIGAINDGEVTDYLSIPGIKNAQEVFAVNVWGDSMEPNIKDGSVIICRKDVEIRDGEIGAFLLNDEAYVKRIKVTNQYVALMSDNPNYPPIFIGPGENLIAVGKVIKVLSDI